jgi:hypothetical protein
MMPMRKKKMSSSESEKINGVTINIRLIKHFSREVSAEITHRARERVSEYERRREKPHTQLS